MPFWRTFYHLVWTTDGRLPLITPELEAIIFPTIIHRANELGGIVYALNGTADHVHLAVAIPPRQSVAGFVGELKGRSSFVVNHRFPQLDPRFAWQTGYGVLTFGEKQLPWVRNYIHCQQEHHAAQKTVSRLEHCLEDEDGPPPVLPGRAIDGSAGE